MPTSPFGSCRTAAMSMIELVVGLAVAAVAALGINALYRQYLEGRELVRSRANADRELQTLLSRVEKEVSLRLTKVPPLGAGIPFDFTFSLLPPAPLALLGATACHGLSLRSRTDTTIALTRIKTWCADDLDLADGVLDPISGVARCPTGKRPVVAVETWDDENSLATPSRSQFFPASAPVGATTLQDARARADPVAMQLCFSAVRHEGRITGIVGDAAAGHVSAAGRSTFRALQRSYPVGLVISEATTTGGDIEVRERGTTERIR